MATIEVERRLLVINGHSIELMDLIGQLSTDLENGLTRDETTNRFTIYGPNEIPKPKWSFW